MFIVVIEGIYCFFSFYDDGGFGDLIGFDVEII